MSTARGADERDAREGPRSASSGRRITVLAIIADDHTRALLPRVLAHERLIIANDPVRGLSFAELEAPDVVFIDVTIGGGAGLAMVHHLKAVAPDASIFALATNTALEAGAHAVALGGTGLLMMPVGGDEILNAVGSVKLRMAERAVRAELEQQISMSARAAGWIARMAELASAPSRTAATQRVADVLMEATGATGAAVYLTASEIAPSELLLSIATAGIERAPSAGSELDILHYARRERLLDVPLVFQSTAVGRVLLRDPEDAGMPVSDGSPTSSLRRSALRDGLLKLLITQASAAIALLTERERLRGLSVMRDATSSAYSFAYYVDVAGREIYKATRFGRRLSIVVLLLDPTAPASGPRSGPPSIKLPLAADYLLKTSPEMSVLARVDDDELHMLLPESNGLAAHACRRKTLAQLAAAGRDIGRPTPARILAGIASFPHDGHDLTKLHRVARRRAEASATSVVHRLEAGRTSVPDILAMLQRVAAETAGVVSAAAPRALEIPMGQAAALVGSVLAEALRGGAASAVVTYHTEPNLFSTVRYAMGSTSRNGITFRALDIRAADGCADIEALCVLAESGTYALVGRIEGTTFRGAHTSDPLLADLLADRIGRAAGVRVFG